MNILQALRLKKNIKLAAVGAGGKSSFLFDLGYQLPGKVIISTTTHISIEQSRMGDIHIVENDPMLFDKIRLAEDNAVIVITGSYFEVERVNGPSNEVLERISRFCDDNDCSVLLEADGSKKLPLKAHGENEPVVPSWINVVVHVVGCSAFNQLVGSDTIFRLEKYCQLTNQIPGEIISVPAVCRLLNHAEGGLKHIRAAQNSIILFNQLDQITPGVLSEIEQYIPDLLTCHNQVLFGTTSNSPKEINEIRYCYENTAGVILAAGGSNRLGTLKQLLIIGNESFLRLTIKKAIDSHLAPIIVVLGHEYDRLNKEIEDLPITIVNNNNWQKGQSTSVIEGSKHLSAFAPIGGALFMTIDQPFLNEATIQKIVRCHTSNIGKSIVPRCDGQNGSPVLIDADSFSEIRKVKGDKGARSILHTLPHTYLDIHNCKELLDIDTKAQYDKHFGSE
ncbi:MAG: putative selenium-dependent hydroxylase accessory protein YqeC [Anaerolineaceae bacterium]|nr:putative selenium-dependent hydroxylase accessory protein YqeC [Anaerolineaceae bacterium]